MKYLVLVDRTVIECIGLLAWDDRSEVVLETVGQDWLKLDRRTFDQLKTNPKVGLMEFKDREAYERGKKRMYGCANGRRKDNGCKPSRYPDHPEIRSFGGFVVPAGYRRLPLNRCQKHAIRREFETRPPSIYGGPKTVQDIALDWDVSEAAVYRIGRGNEVD